MSRTPLKKVALNKNSINEIATEFARFIVCREGSKTPIRKEEIIKHLEINCNMPRSCFKDVIGPATEILKQVYGYRLHPNPDTSKNTYIVTLEEACDKHEGIYDPELRILLIAALTHIYMSGGTVSEDRMWMFLKEAHLIDDKEIDKKNILRKIFTEKMYLEYKPAEKDDEYIFKWGLRAEKEIPKMLLLKKMSQAFDRDVTFWPEQYKTATQDAQ